MFKNFSNYVYPGVFLAAGIILSACSGGTNKLPVLNNDAVSVAGGYISVAKTQGTRVEKVKKLVIPVFNVTHKLKVEGTAVTVTKEGDKEVTSKIDVKVNLGEANVAMMQDVTNKAYNIFIGELEKSGLEVVSIDDVTKSESYFDVNHKDLVTSVTIEDDSITLVPDGLKYYDPNDKMDPDGSFLMGVANINSAVNGDLVAEFGGVEKGVAVLNVEMVVQYGNFDLEDHRVSPYLSFNPSFTVLGNDTKMEVITDFKAVSMPGKVFYIPKEKAAYAMSQDMGSKTSVLSGMLIVNSEEGAEEYNAILNESAYTKAALEQVERVSQLLVTAMAE